MHVVTAALSGSGTTVAGGLDHESPLVREHAAWATGRLGESAVLRRRRRVEDDARVQRAIDTALDEGAGP